MLAVAESGGDGREDSGRLADGEGCALSDSCRPPLPPPFPILQDGSCASVMSTARAFARLFGSADRMTPLGFVTRRSPSGADSVGEPRARRAVGRPGATAKLASPMVLAALGAAMHVIGNGSRLCWPA